MLVRISYEYLEKESTLGSQWVTIRVYPCPIFCGQRFSPQSEFNHNQIGGSAEKRGFKCRTGFNTSVPPSTSSTWVPALAQKGGYVLHYRAEERTILCVTLRVIWHIGDQENAAIFRPLPLPTNPLPRRSLPCASLPLASFEAPLSCLRPHAKLQGSRRSGHAAQSPSRYNRWAARRSR